MILISRNNVEPDNVLIGAMALAVADVFYTSEGSGRFKEELRNVIEREFHKRFEITHRTKSV